MRKKDQDLNRSIVPPLYLGVAHHFDTAEDGAEIFKDPIHGYAYGRMGNPNVTQLEHFLAEMEGVKEGSVWATGSGLSALALLAFGLTAKPLGLGKRIITSSFIYGGSYHQLQILRDHHGFDVVFVSDPFSACSWRKAIAPGAAFVLLETPANPTVDVFDISEVASIAHEYNTFLVVDNTVAVTLQKPLALGADAVLYSVTKALNRTSTGLGGAIIGAPQFMKKAEEVLNDYHVSFGSIMHPLSAWLTLLNSTTLEDSMHRFSENALVMANMLDCHKKVKIVNYPFLPENRNYQLAQRQMGGGGGLLSFELENFEAAKAFVETLQEIDENTKHAPHLGDQNKTLVIHPASTTHSKLSEEELSETHITPGLVRMSVSLGNMAKLMHDCEQALARI